MLLARLSAFGGLSAGDPAATVQLELPAAVESPRQARQAIRDACARWGTGVDVCGRAELAVSELVTNAVIHARTPVLLLAEYDGHNLTIAVGDGDAQMPTVAPPSLVREEGRGMSIVDQLGATWGVQRTVLGKTVWVSLHVR